MEDAAPRLEQVRRAPKVLLHDHLDGGLRPATVVELAAACGYEDLPTNDPAALGRWFVAETPRRNLVRYLEGFTHTVAVMQTAEALERVARECVEDLSEDGVVYAEVRFAPELHTEEGLHLEAVVETVLAGFAVGMAQACAAGRPIVVRALLTAMRTAARSLEIAELAVRYRDTGVAGFDVAGPKPVTRRHCTWKRSPWYSERTFMPLFMPGKPSGCRRSGKRCNGVGRSGWATGSVSSTTSRSTGMDEWPWGGWPATFATSASRWSYARLPTSIPARSGAWLSTRSGCCGGLVSGPRSTPTTGL